MNEQQSSIYKHSMKLERRTASLYVQNTGCQQCPPGYGWGPGVRGHYLLHHVVGGGGVYTCRDKRYGVWSQVLVQNRKTQTTQCLVNEPFAAQGLCCGRVLTVPGKSGYQAMRWTGHYQLDRSAEERFRLELTLSNAGPCQPGDTVTLSLEKPRLSGVYKVLETCTAQDSRGLRTRLTLGSA